MHDHTQLWALAAVIVVALTAGAAFTRLRQPALVGYLLSGILLGPSGLAVVETRDHVSSSPISASCCCCSSSAWS